MDTVAVQQQVVLPPAEDIIRQFLFLRNYLEAENEAHEKRMEPTKQAMATLKAAANLLMYQTKQKALSTYAGVAFYDPKTSVTCEDPKKWQEFVKSGHAFGGLTNHVNKEWVEEWMESHEGRPPPGIKVSTFLDVKFRKA